ncbi:HD domain-containing protein [Fulvivirga sp. 2943]|uniref:5'-deoxynucleotidase n=2 Tax=Fulvivirga sediminis TaxID=2803949 RepID=A0A937FAJ0_9BACT|nr:HD domain-containing protein [Fulvivirga sediminis]
MNMERLLKQIEFIKQIDQLKYIARKTKLFNSDRHENDAEHSWHLAMMAMVLLEHANEEVDLLKVIKMVLIHDIVEIDAGDTFLYDTSKDHVNTEEELVAANRIFGLLPEDQAEEFIAIWREFEAAETKEAKFAKTLDRFEPVLQNLSNQGGTWAEYDVELSRIFQKIGVIENGSDFIWEYTKEEVQQCAEKGIIRNK